MADSDPLGQQRLPGFEQAEGGGNEDCILTKLYKSGLMDKCLEAIQEKSGEGADGCVTTSFAHTGGGYSQIRFQKVKYGVHRVAAMKKMGRPPKKGEEASHLCHNRHCCNPEHLFFEDGEVNKSRLCCKLYGTMDGFKCPHLPVCFGCSSLH